MPTKTMQNHARSISFGDFMPPIVSRFDEFMTRPRIYSSYQEALASLKNPENYENPEITSVVYKKTLAFIKQTPKVLERENLRLLYAGSRSARAQRCDVIDFGGACGAAYFVVRKFTNIKVNWLVVDTPRMVAEAKELSDSHLNFTSNFPHKQVDLIYSSGTLQYLEHAYEMLRKLVKTSPRYILLDRLCMDQEEKVFIQRSRPSENGMGRIAGGTKDKYVSYVKTTLLKDKILEILGTKYEVICESGPSEVPYAIFCRRR